MLAGFFSWWLARMTELLPSTWRNDARPRDGIVIDIGPNDDITALIRCGGQLQPLSLGAAARSVGRRPIFLRPPPEKALVKHHTVPTAPRRQLDQMLRHELARITPFAASELFWRWDGHPKSGDGSRTEVVLTMVPRMALAPAMDALETVGLKADFVEVGATDRPRLLPMGKAVERSAGTMLIRGLSWACIVLAVVALALPFVLQTLAFRSTEAAIAELQPAISSIAALRQGIAAGEAGRDILAREAEKTGDVLQILATVTRILPDDTYLTDFSLRERQMTLSGRSASAPRLITGLSAAPEIRNAAFAAPVTRLEGAASDAFSIKAEAAR